MKKAIVITSAILVPFIAILSGYFFLIKTRKSLEKIKTEAVEVENTEVVEEVEKPIGGQRDEYGCLGPAGYGYNEEVGACIRQWELDENQKKASKLAVEYLGHEPSITIIEASFSGNIGNFIVTLEKGTEMRDRIKVTIENWEATKKSLTPNECEELGGRIVNIVGGETCEEYEENIGEVTGFISLAICCIKKN